MAGEVDVDVDVDVSNYDDRDPISLESIADLLRGGGGDDDGGGGGNNVVFTVDMGGDKTHAYDADAWLTHLTTDQDYHDATTASAGTQRRQGHVVTRQQLKPSEIWACFSAVLEERHRRVYMEALKLPFEEGMERVLAVEDATAAAEHEDADPRIVKCLSVEVVGKRTLRSVDPVTRKGKYKVSLAPVSPLFNMRVKRMAKVGEGYAAYDLDDGDQAAKGPPQPTQCYKVAYDLVDSRDSTRVVGQEREVQIMCPVGDVLAVI